jgi:predicted Rossmann fold flavoprotein
MGDFDVVIVGAGAAGLFCAGVAGQLGQRVLLLDHSPKVAEKIRISGGGRCNFTNKDLEARSATSCFISDNPDFCKSALARYTPKHFMDLLHQHQVPFHEKHKGQMFCDRSAEDLIQVLLKACDAARVKRHQPCRIQAVRQHAGGYQLDTDLGCVQATALVVATGGLSIPKAGASAWGYDIARQFGVRLVPTRAALVPLTFDAAAWAPYAQLAGLSLPVRIETGSRMNKTVFWEDLLFTHRGLSGPAVLQISSYWKPKTPIRINLVPEIEASQALLQAKLRSQKLIANELADWMPTRLADTWTQANPVWMRPVNQASDKSLLQLGEALNTWALLPSGSEGYAKAEVTAGGVDTRDLSSQTMESIVKGLYFIGEVVDVTGWLGGYNFQWAWASAYACAHALAAGK